MTATLHHINKRIVDDLILRQEDDMPRFANLRDGGNLETPYQSWAGLGISAMAGVAVAAVIALCITVPKAIDNVHHEIATARADQ